LLAPVSERVELVEDWEECKQHENRWMRTFTPRSGVLKLLESDTREWERIVLLAGASGFTGPLARSAFAQALARDRARNDSDLIATVQLGHPPICVAWNATRLVCRRILRQWRDPICVTTFDYQWSFLQFVAPYRQQFFVVADVRSET
jgi:hypothetical protein